jgi:CRP-like cAMP-binding protein
VPVTVRVLDTREELLGEQSVPGYLFLQKEGWAQRVFTACESKRRIVTLLLRGGFCNLNNLLFERAEFSVRTLTEAVVLWLPRQRASNLMGNTLASLAHPPLKRWPKVRS